MNNLGTYSNNKEPFLNLETLQEAIDLLPEKLFKIPEVVFYLEREVVPENVFYKFPDLLLRTKHDIISFNPNSRKIIFDLFKELNIKLFPFEGLFPWCLKYRIDNRAAKENYDEFWNTLSNAFENTVRNKPSVDRP